MREYSCRTREQRMKEIIIGQTIVTLLILIISASLVFWGFGYRIDFKNLRIYHTGIVSLTFSPRDAKVTIGNKNYTSGSTFSQAFVPGFYNITISKTGYQSWQTMIDLPVAQVDAFKNIVLFRQNPKISIITDQSTISSIDSPYDTLVTNPAGDLSTNDYEIWNGNNLVSRFSSKISGVIWYPGSEYIAYQINDQIRIIDKSGSNDVLLVKLSSSTPTKFIFSWDGGNLLYRDGADYKSASIN